MLLVFIITPHSIATVAYSSKETKNAQGWIAMSIWVTAIIVYAIIKFIVWDYLDNKVNNTKS